MSEQPTNRLRTPAQVAGAIHAFLDYRAESFCTAALQEDLDWLNSAYEAGAYVEERKTGIIAEYLQSVELDGWTRKPTEHSLWSYIVDAKGRERCSIFYKAAFYDRRAFMGLCCFWNVSHYEETGKKYINERGYEYEVYAGQVTNADGFKSELYEIREEATEWVQANYPDYRNPFAYWTE